MIVGCYDLHMYCDRNLPMTGKPHDKIEAGQEHRYDEFPHMLTGKSRGNAIRQARIRGWVFHRDGRVTCPRCAKAGKSASADQTNF